MKRPAYALLLVLAVAAAVAVYANSLQGTFVFDDKPMITTYDLVKDVRNIPAAFVSSTTVYGYTNYYRPIQTVSNMVDYAAWKGRAFGFHASNVLYHVLAMVAVYFLICLLFRNRPCALLTAFFFGIHPVHSSVVSYIAGRADSLLCIFTLLCLYWYVRFNYETRKKFYLVLSVFFFVLSLLTKESALFLPVFIVVFDAYLYRWTALDSGKKMSPLHYAPYIGVAMAYLVFRLTSMSFFVPGAIEPFPFFDRLMTAPYALLQYLRLIILPNDLHIERLPWVADSVSDPRVLLSSAILLVLTLAFVAARRRCQPAFFGFLWFLLFIFPSLNIITPLFSTIAENWMYMPSIGVFLVLAFFVTKRYAVATDAAAGIGRRLVAGFILLYMVSLSAVTIVHNRAWRDEAAVCLNTIKFNPLSFKMHNNLGVSYLGQREFDKAESSFKRCLEIKPDTGMAYFNLYRVYMAQGKPALAKESLQKARQLDPRRIDIIMEKMGIREE